MEPAQGAQSYSFIIMMALIFGVFYFIVIMPAKKQQKIAY